MGRHYTDAELHQIVRETSEAGIVLLKDHDFESASNFVERVGVPYANDPIAKGLALLNTRSHLPNHTDWMDLQDWTPGLVYFCAQEGHLLERSTYLDMLAFREQIPDSISERLENDNPLKGSPNLLYPTGSGYRVAGDMSEFIATLDIPDQTLIEALENDVQVNYRMKTGDLIFCDHTRVMHGIRNPIRGRQIYLCLLEKINHSLPFGVRPNDDACRTLTSIEAFYPTAQSL